MRFVELRNKMKKFHILLESDNLRINQWIAYFQWTIFLKWFNKYFMKRKTEYQKIFFTENLMKKLSKNPISEWIPSSENTFTSWIIYYHIKPINDNNLYPPTVSLILKHWWAILTFFTHPINFLLLRESICKYYITKWKSIDFTTPELSLSIWINESSHIRGFHQIQIVPYEVVTTKGNVTEFLKRHQIRKGNIPGTKDLCIFCIDSDLVSTYYICWQTSVRLIVVIPNSKEIFSMVNIVFSGLKTLHL